MQSFGALSQFHAVVPCRQCGDDIIFTLGKPLMLEPYEDGTLHPICDVCIDDEEDTCEVVLATFACEVGRPENSKLFAPTIKQAIAELNHGSIC
jgi:hypothetical protein